MTSSSTTAEAPAPEDGRPRPGRDPRQPRRRPLVAAAVVVLLVIVAAMVVAVEQARTRAAAPTTACPRTADGEVCWQDRTGVVGWPAGDIVAGRSPLTLTTGDLVVDIDGTVIRDRWIEGCIAVRASDVTIENVLVRSDHGCTGGRISGPPALISTGQHGGGVRNLVVRDTEIDGLGVSGDTMAIGQSSYTCLRCDIHGTAKGAKADQDVRLVDSYVHDLADDGVTHTEAFFFDGGDGRIVVQGNWMRANPTLSTAAVALINDWPGRAIVVRDNFLDGNGAVALVGGAVADKDQPAMTDVVVVGNALVGLDAPDGPHHAHSFDAAGHGNRWEDNRDASSGAIVDAPR